MPALVTIFADIMIAAVTVMLATLLVTAGIAILNKPD